MFCSRQRILARHSSPLRTLDKSLLQELASELASLSSDMLELESSLHPGGVTGLRPFYVLPCAENSVLL